MLRNITHVLIMYYQLRHHKRKAIQKTAAHCGMPMYGGVYARDKTRKHTSTLGLGMARACRHAILQANQGYGLRRHCKRRVKYVTATVGYKHQVNDGKFELSSWGSFSAVTQASDPLREANDEKRPACDAGRVILAGDFPNK